LTGKCASFELCLDAVLSPQLDEFESLLIWMNTMDYMNRAGMVQFSSVQFWHSSVTFTLQVKTKLDHEQTMLARF
jgi:hypothetical protein